MLARLAEPIKVTTSVAIGIMLLVLSGCSIFKSVGMFPDSPAKSPQEIPYSLSVMITATETSNPVANKQPSPVRIRLFLTEPNSDLSRMPFEVVFGLNDSQPIDKPLSTMVISPGDTQIVELQAMKSQSQLIVAAAFYDLHNAVWIANKTLDTDVDTTHKVRINSSTVEIN